MLEIRNFFFFFFFFFFLVGINFWSAQIRELPLPTTEMHTKERGEGKKATKEDLSLQQQQRWMRDCRECNVMQGRDLIDNTKQ